MKTKTILIIGGKDKGNDYDPIKPLVKEKCAGLVYLGADNQKLHDNFDALGIPVRDTHSMKECIQACYEMAEPSTSLRTWKTVANSSKPWQGLCSEKTNSEK